MVQTTRAQREALQRLYLRWKGTGDTKAPKSYRELRKRVMPGFGYIGVEWCGMFIGIEKDGYAHS